MQGSTKDSRKSHLTEQMLQGLLAENMVICELLRLGYPAFLAPAGSGYDVIADIDNQLVRIQVKSTKAKRKTNGKNQRYQSYLFTINRKGKSQYSENAFDICALVALDINCIGFLPSPEVFHKAKIQFKGPDDRVNAWSKKDKGLHQLPFKEAYDRFRHLQGAPDNASKRLRKKG